MGLRVTVPTVRDKRLGSEPFNVDISAHVSARGDIRTEDFGVMIYTHPPCLIEPRAANSFMIRERT